PARTAPPVARHALAPRPRPRQRRRRPRRPHPLPVLQAAAAHLAVLLAAVRRLGAGRLLPLRRDPLPPTLLGRLRPAPRPRPRRPRRPLRPTARARPVDHDGNPHP